MEPKGKQTEKVDRKESDLLQLVSFFLDEEEYGIEILKVQEIIRMQQITRVPNSAPFVEGVINLRGKVIPVIGLRKRFGMPARDVDRQTRIVVIDVAETVLGFVVDAVSEVLRISKATIEPPPQLAKVEQEFISGVGKLENRLLMLLNVDCMMKEVIGAPEADVGPGIETASREPEPVPAHG